MALAASRHLAGVDNSSGVRRQLTFLAVPASLPAEFTNLTALVNLEIIGDGNSPVSLYVVLFVLVGGMLTATRSRGIRCLVRAQCPTSRRFGAVPDILQNVASLILVRNAQVGSSLPPSIGDGLLRSLCVARLHYHDLHG